MRRWAIGTAALALALASAPALGGVAEGNAAWLAGNYDKAIAEWRPAADAGSPEAQFNLGQAYKLGRGVSMNMTEAETWYRRAAMQGFAEAEDMLGLMLFRQGDRQEAMPWIQKSASRGDPRAMYVLGTAKFNGDYAGKDWAGAYALMSRAADGGLPQAKTSLVQMEKFLSPAEKAQARTLIAQAPAPAPVRNVETGMAEAGTAAPPAARPAYVPVNPAAGAGRYPAPPAPMQTAQAAPSSSSSYPAPDPASPTAGPTVEIDGTSVAVPGSEVPIPPGLTGPQPIRNVPVPASAPPPFAAPPAEAAIPDPAPAAAPRPQPRPRPAPAVRAAGGPWKVQLGAFATPGGAGEGWARLGRLPALRGLRYAPQPFGRITRLQAAGLASKAEAQRVCRAVAATGNPCFPVAP